MKGPKWGLVVRARIELIGRTVHNLIELVYKKRLDPSVEGEERQRSKCPGK